MKKFIGLLLRYPLYLILRPFMWLYVVVFQHVRFKKNHLKVPKGPVLLLSNHLSNWDGIYLLCMFYTRIIHFIVHDELFKNKLFSFVSGDIFGQVKRGMTNSDISDILAMKKLVKQKKTIGIFPEGDIDMFGRTLPIPASIAKFVKMMNVPVLLLRIEGACIRATRWGKYAHHSHITYTLRKVLSVDEIKNMDIPTLHQTILKEICGDDLAYQAKKMYKQWPAFKRAEWLELGVYMCPVCHQFETMKSKGDKVFCTKCGFKAKYNRYAMIDSNGILPFQTLTAWDDLQYEHLIKRIDEAEDNEVILEGQDLDFYITKRVGYFHKPIGKANLKVYKDRIVYQLNDQQEVSILISDMMRIALQYKDVLELHFGEDRIRFRTLHRKWSAYMFFKALKYLKENADSKKS